MKKYVLFASAILAFASCASDSFTGTDEAGRVAQGEKPISFGFDVPAATRAEGAVAAGKLNHQFIVYAEKNETNGNAPAEGNLVFPNYKVTYGANTAYTTTSNTKDWEYVGLKWDAADAANVKMGGTAATTNDQTIKYWDYAATGYTFTAVSAKPEDIAAGRVVINKLTTGTTVYDKGYTVTLAKDASDNYPSLADLYFADRQPVASGSGKDRTASNAYGGNVTFTFRNSLTQVRAGIYETIPGYQVTAIKFYVTGDAEAKNGGTDAFGVIAPNVGGNNFEGTINVTYYDNNVAATENHPKLEITPDGGLAKTDLILGTNPNTVSKTKPLGTTATAPTWDTDGGAFTPVLPQIDNTTNMKLKVDYTLYNELTKETINITGKTAEVPGKYLAWKPNFKYTYLFKITDSDLYPITFDAVVIEAEDGTAEYITTVTEPSITTFGVKGTNYQVGHDQYENGSDVYATIVDAGAVIDPTSNYNVYTVTTTNATTYPITEGSVAESIAEVSAKTHQVTCTPYTTNVSETATVPGEDGKDITLPAGKAIKMAGLAAGTYAVEYVKTAATYKAQEVTFATQAEYDAAFAATNLYTDPAMTSTSAAAADSWTGATTKFYKKVVDNAGVYAYKVIVVQ